jgi:hypothetical protein
VRLGGVLIAVLLATACMGPDPLPGYVPAPDDVRTAVIQKIEWYYALFGAATLSGDMAAFYAAFPKLAEGEVREAGINSEAFFVRVARMPDVNVVDLRFELEWYEKIRVYQRADQAVAFVRGLYHKRYAASPIEGSGEMFVRFDLRRESDRWLIERSDELVLGERPPRTPRP